MNCLAFVSVFDTMKLWGGQSKIRAGMKEECLLKRLDLQGVFELAVSTDEARVKQSLPIKNRPNNFIRVLWLIISNIFETQTPTFSKEALWEMLSSR